MKRELFLAILFGAILGFAVTGTVWLKKEGKLSLFKTSSEKQTETAEENVNEGTPSPAPAEEKETGKVFLEVSSPEQDSISDKEKITISGKTLENAIVVVVWEEGEDILVADGEGAFETEIVLVSGENQIDVTAYDDDGSSTAKTITVTYSTAKI